MRARRASLWTSPPGGHTVRARRCASLARGRGLCDLNRARIGILYDRSSRRLVLWLGQDTDTEGTNGCENYVERFDREAQHRRARCATVRLRATSCRIDLDDRAPERRGEVNGARSVFLLHELESECAIELERPLDIAGTENN